MRGKESSRIRKVSNLFGFRISRCIDLQSCGKQGAILISQSDLSTRREKVSQWNPTFARLNVRRTPLYPCQSILTSPKSLREARGPQIHPRDFAPRASYSHTHIQSQSYRPAPQLAHPGLRSAPPPSSTSTQALKRKPTSPLRTRYQDLDRQTPHSNAKRSCSDTSRSYAKWSSASWTAHHQHSHPLLGPSQDLSTHLLSTIPPRLRQHPSLPTSHTSSFPFQIT